MQKYCWSHASVKVVSFSIYLFLHLFLYSFNYYCYYYFSASCKSCVFICIFKCVLGSDIKQENKKIKSKISKATPLLWFFWTSFLPATLFSPLMTSSYSISHNCSLTLCVLFTMSQDLKLYITCCCFFTLLGDRCSCLRLSVCTLCVVLNWNFSAIHLVCNYCSETSSVSYLESAAADHEANPCSQHQRGVW